MMSFDSARNLYANVRLRSVSSVSSANGLAPPATVMDLRSSPKIRAQHDVERDVAHVLRDIDFVAIIGAH